LADRNSHYSIKGIAQLPIRAARLANCASYLFFFCAAHLANWHAVDKLDICAARLDNRAGLLNARNIFMYTHQTQLSLRFAQIIAE